MTDPLRCWCGNQQLEPFSDTYLRCPVCNTLVCIHLPAIALIPDHNEDAYYGRNYWLDHQESELGKPNIFSRTRTDFLDRIPYWLKTVLKYCLPPGKTLEVGSAHSAFVAVLNQAGFDGMGLELSPWVVQYAQKTFNVPVLLGPLEQQSLEPGSLDLLIMMDVAEHLSDPVTTIQHAVELLKPDGKLVIQTPKYPSGKSYQDLVDKIIHSWPC